MKHEWLLAITCDAPGARPDLEAYPEGDALALYEFARKMWDLDEEDDPDEDITLTGDIVTVQSSYLTYLEPVIDWVMAYLIPVKVELKRLD